MDLETIGHFVETVDLILSEMEVNNAGGSIQIFLDTADVRGAALGMYAYYESGAFQSKLFDHDRALVRALAGRGFLGTFHMLGPHEAEFLTLLNDGFGVRNENVSQYASRFWQDAGILAERTSLRELTDEQVRDIVAKQVGNGPNFFKAVEAIRGDWRSRLKEWHRTGTFGIVAAPDDVIPLLRSKEFEVIRTRLDRRRPQLTDNNFADAIALVSLMRKIEIFNASEGAGALPCFYAAPHFLGVVKSAGFADQLVVRLPNGRRVAALRSADYFILRAIFHRAEDLGAEDGMLFTPVNLRTIHHEMSEILAVNRVLRNDQREGVDVPTSEAINALVNEVRELSFFDNIWLPYRAEKDAQDSLRRLEASDYVMTRAELQSTLMAEVRHLQNALKTNAERFETLRSLWSDIPKEFEQRQKQLRAHTETESDLMRRTGLLRFSFPPLARERIFKVIASLVSTQQQRRKDAIATVVRSYLSFTAGNRSTALDAELAAAVLWVAELDSYILQLLSASRRAHFSLDVVYAAAAVRLGRDLNLALETYSTLEEQRMHTVVPSERADIALGLAYLYFHLWHRYRDNEHEQLVVRKYLGFTRVSDIIELAVARAREAYAVLEKLPDEAKFVYVLNQLVYFMSIAMMYPIEDVKRLAEKLRDYEERNLWQYRFDDTLARYYLFRAKHATDFLTKEEYLILGLERAKLAYKVAPEDREIKITFETVRDELATLREERSRSSAPIR